MEKEIYILGDIEMGGGTITDDFISDKYLSKFILELAKKDNEIDLILNGDTFDLLKCPYPEKDTFTYTRYITEKVSLAKLDLIFKAHTSVFDALSTFTKKNKHKLFFIYGNHDIDLVYSGVQKAIKTRIKNKKNIYFKVKYNYHSVYVEHGMQYDHLNKANFKKLHLDYDGKRILNIPWISFGIISTFLTLKEEHPFLERIATRPILFSRYRKIIRTMSIRGIFYLLKSIIYFPWRHLTDPTYQFPTQILGELYTRLKIRNWDVDGIIDTFKRKKKRTLGKNRIYVLGHIHERYLEKKEGITIIHPGSWRDEYDLNKDNILTQRVKAYVKIKVNNIPECSIIEYPIERKQLDFGKLIGQELKYIKEAAEEEEYRLSLTPKEYY